MTKINRPDNGLAKIADDLERTIEKTVADLHDEKKPGMAVECRSRFEPFVGPIRVWAEAIDREYPETKIPEIVRPLFPEGSYDHRIQEIPRRIPRVTMLITEPRTDIGIVTNEAVAQIAAWTKDHPDAEETLTVSTQIVKSHPLVNYAIQTTFVVVSTLRWTEEVS